MSKNQLPKWTPERETELKKIVGREKPVSVNTINTAATDLRTTNKSIAAKLRKLGYDVESLAETTGKKYTEAQEKELRTFVERNSGKYTYAEIASKVLKGEYSAKQIQGKLLSMELYGDVKETPKVEVEKKYSEEQEATILAMAKENKYIEDIAEAVEKDVRSVRGKILSMLSKYEGLVMPKQRNHKESVVKDPFSTLDNIEKMSVAEIAEAVDKSERSVKTMLTHRGITCVDYKGKEKAEKIAKKKAEAKAA